MFSLATQPVPGRPNEDFVLATADLAVVVDGSGTPSGGCSHGVPWYSRQLAAHILAALAAEPDLPLADGLARGIHAVARLHIYACDLSVPGSPGAAVGILRIGTDTVDTLALSDAVVVVDTDAGPQVTHDLPVEGGPGGSPAASDPRVAYRARTNSYPRSFARRAAALSSGAARPVVPLRLHSWPDYLDLLDRVGPAGAVAHARSVETGEPDDASVAHAPSLR